MVEAPDLSFSHILLHHSRIYNSSSTVVLEHVRNVSHVKHVMQREICDVLRIVLFSTAKVVAMRIDDCHAALIELASLIRPTVLSATAMGTGMSSASACMHAYALLTM